MKKLVFAALCCAGLAQFATGCVVVDPSTISAEWSLVSGDANTPTDCPAGATTIAMYSTETATQQRIVSVFPCGDEGGTTEDLLPGLYYTYLQLEDETGNITYAQSRGTDVTVYDQADSPLSFEMSIDRGQFSVNWQVRYGGSDADCATANGVTMRLDYAGETQAPFNDQFGCEEQAVTTAVIPLDRWTVTPSLIDDIGDSLAIGDPIDANFEYGNQLIDLGTVVFDVPAVVPLP